MADEDVKRALMEALGMGQRPRSRPEGMGESGRTISDADKLKMMMMKMGESGKTISDADYFLAKYYEHAKKQEIFQKFQGVRYI